MSDFLALISLIATIFFGLVAALAVVVTILVHRREHPRREFTYDIRSTKLVPGRLRGLPKLSVAYDGAPLSDPVLVIIEVGSTGRADISSSSFDGQKPISFEMGVPVLVEVDQSASLDSVSARLEMTPGDSTIQLAPALLPKQFSIRASYLCNGHPEIKPKIELADISVRNANSLRISKNRYVDWAGKPLLSVAALYVVVPLSISFFLLVVTTPR